MIWGWRKPPVANDMSDVDLVNQLVDGKRAVFPVFYHRYARLIRHCIIKRTHLEPDDLLQDFFVKLQANDYRPLDRWNRQTPLSSYLSFIVKNFVIDRYRADPGSPGRATGGKKSEIISSNIWSGVGRRPARGGDSSASDDEAEASEWYEAPDAQLESRELRRRGIEAWARLSSARDRRLICGKFHRDTPPEEAAASEGLSSNTFRKAIFDAQRRYTVLLRVTASEFYS